MTVNLEIPIVQYEGDGEQTLFDFTWTCDDKNEIVVWLDQVRQLLDDTFELVDFEIDQGGAVRFFDPPAKGVIIDIFRETPVTQQVDYVEFDSFPAETHEGQMDKDTRILQEIIEGGRGIGGPANLSAIQEAFQVIIDNTAGENATIRMWECSGDVAGVFAGEVVDPENIPTNGEATDKPSGYFWFLLEETDIGVPIPPDPGDPPGTPTYSIVLPVGSFSASPLSTTSSQVTELIVFRNNANKAQLRYGARGEAQTTRDIVRPRDFGAGKFWYRHLVQSGSPTQITPADGQWADLYAPDAALDDTFQIVAEDGGVVVAIVEVAPDDGAGAPDTLRSVFATFTLVAGVEAGTPPVPDPDPADVTNMPLTAISESISDFGADSGRTNGFLVQWLAASNEFRVLDVNSETDIESIDPLFVPPFTVSGPGQFFVRLDTSEAADLTAASSPTNTWIDADDGTVQWITAIPSESDNPQGGSRSVQGTLRWCQGQNGAPDLTTEYTRSLSLSVVVEPDVGTYLNMPTTALVLQEPGDDSILLPNVLLLISVNGNNRGAWSATASPSVLSGEESIDPLTVSPFTVTGAGQLFVRLDTADGSALSGTSDPANAWLDVFADGPTIRWRIVASGTLETLTGTLRWAQGSGGTPDLGTEQSRSVTLEADDS